MKKSKYLDAKKYVTKEFKHLKKLPHTCYYKTVISEGNIIKVATARTFINGTLHQEGVFDYTFCSLKEALANTREAVIKVFTENNKVWLRKPAELRVYNGKYAIRIRLAYID
jgi:hypothetical protein